jgi:hypothetical protein
MKEVKRAGNVNCVYCGHKLKLRQQMYCSRECARRSQTKRPETKRIYGKCVICGTETVGQIEKKYCSKKCEYQSRQHIQKCKVCGKDFWTKYALNCSSACRRIDREQMAVQQQAAAHSFEMRPVEAEKKLKKKLSEEERIELVVVRAYQRGDEYERQQIYRLNPKINFEEMSNANEN